ALRHALAPLLGFQNYAEESIATKMADNTQQVLHFLNDLAERSDHQGEQEVAQLAAFAKEHYGVDKLEPWDMAYFADQQKQHLFYVSDVQLRPYFTEEKA
ncbi:oligopeptidase A, partial [Morganella morganii]|uniref:M3 family metallopeptidase n=1 Tax=Morganella morganii TaxID=582 RepID=UPI0019FF42E0